MVPYLPEPIHSMLAQRPHIMPSGPGVHTAFSYTGVLMSRTGGCMSGGPICFGGKGLPGQLHLEMPLHISSCAALSPCLDVPILYASFAYAV